MTSEEMAAKRMAELARRAFNNNYYTYTAFLGLAEQSILEMEKRTNGDIANVGVYLNGGADGCERVVAAFGDEEAFGYPPEFPITCLKVEPVMQKYADRLTHRDFLGSLMNLGVEREVIGDIIVKDNTGYIFCLESIAGYISDNLERIKHTNVSCIPAEEAPQVVKDAVRMEIQVSSARIDACIAKIYKISREKAVLLIKGGKVYVNGMLCASASYRMSEDDVISVRGCGRFIYLGVRKSTRKGNLQCEVLKLI